MATEFKLPEVGEGIESGTVVGVLVSVGDTVEEDQPLLELETDKAVVEVPSSVSGTVKEIKVSENDEVSIGDVVLVIGDADEADGEADASADEGDDGADEADSSDEDTQEASEGTKDDSDDERADDETADDESADDETSESVDEEEEDIQKASDADDAEEAQESPDSYEVPEEDKQAVPAAPSVRRLAREMGVNLQEVSGSGISGRISAEDVKRYAEDGTTKEDAKSSQKQPSQGQQQAPSAPSLPDFSKFGETSREPMSGIRKATVRSMSTAWSVVPMVTHFDKADITQFNAMRKKYQERAQEAGVKLTPTALLLKMVAGAVKKYPKFNASLDTENNEVVYKHYVNIGVAVDTEQGLLVPVIRDVDKKGIIQLALDLDEMAEKARARKLGPDDMKGGNLSISNLGGIGGTNFTPIVNPPDVAIIGVSRGSVEPVWNKEKEIFEPKMMMPLSVTYDHRLIDGADAARFMRLLCDIIEDPFLMSVEG